MMFRVKLTEGMRTGDVLFESRDRDECVRFVKDMATVIKHVYGSKMEIVDAKVSIYTYNFNDPFKPQLLADYKTYKAARKAVLDPVRDWEDGYKFWWVYDEVNQDVMVCNEDGEMSYSWIYEDWLKTAQPIDNTVPHPTHHFFYSIGKGLELNGKLAEMRLAKTLQLVHLDVTSAKQSTDKEEFREEFFVYMQREDC